jgi:hypothetical protein
MLHLAKTATKLGGDGVQSVTSKRVPLGIVQDTRQKLDREGLVEAVGRWQIGSCTCEKQL